MLASGGGRLGWRFALMLAAYLIGPDQPRSAPPLQGVCASSSKSARNKDESSAGR